MNVLRQCAVYVRGQFAGRLQETSVASISRADGFDCYSQATAVFQKRGMPESELGCQKSLFLNASEQVAIRDTPDIKGAKVIGWSSLPNLMSHSGYQSLPDGNLHQKTVFILSYLYRNPA